MDLREEFGCGCALSDDGIVGEVVVRESVGIDARSKHALCSFMSPSAFSLDSMSAKK